MSQRFTLLLGDAQEQLSTLPSDSVQCCVTSPPYYGLRDYGHEGQIGLEETPEEYVARLVDVFREVRRVLRTDGTLWLNIGDSYARDAGKGGSGPGGKEQAYLGSAYTDAKRFGIPVGLKQKDLVGIPWMLAFALRADGWYLRQDIIWHKPNPMPESVTDRCTKAHEYLFLLSQSERYHYDAEAIAEPATGRHHGNHSHRGADSVAIEVANGVDRERTKLGLTQIEARDTRNRRSVWTVSTSPNPAAHFATFPEALVEPCLLAGTREGDTVLDPFTGSGTTGAVALRMGRWFVGCELNPEYVALATQRCRRWAEQPSLFDHGEVTG